MMFDFGEFIGKGQPIVHTYVEVKLLKILVIWKYRSRKLEKPGFNLLSLYHF